MSIESIEKIYNNIMFSGWMKSKDGSRSIISESVQDEFLGIHARRWIPALLEVAKAAKEHAENPHDYTPRNLKIKLAELEAIK